MTAGKQTTNIPALPPVRTLNGKFDAYCHVCWQPVYRLWIDDVDPSGKCLRGALKATDCPDAMETERFRGQVAKLKRDGVIHD